MRRLRRTKRYWSALEETLKYMMANFPWSHRANDHVNSYIKTLERMDWDTQLATIEKSIEIFSAAYSKLLLARSTRTTNSDLEFDNLIKNIRIEYENQKNVGDV